MPITVAFVVLNWLAAPGADKDTSPFSAAAYASDGVGASSRLMVFPLDRKEFSIPVLLTVRWLAYGAGGRSLYATAFEQLSARSFTTRPGMLKIDLNPTQVRVLPGFDGFYAIGHFAVSRQEDKVVFGGSSQDRAGKKTCGIYEVSLLAGNLRPVVETSDCRAGSPWRVLDLSPTGAEALVLTDRHLALVDLEPGTITPLEGQLWGGSYSPDGKWIAALELAGPRVPSRTILIDRKDHNHRLDLGGLNDDEVVWSPDSRLILHCVPRPACPSQSPLALETLDVQTTKRSIIKSSVCNVGSSRQIGWVRNDVGRQ